MSGRDPSRHPSSPMEPSPRSGQVVDENGMTFAIADNFLLYQPEIPSSFYPEVWPLPTSIGWDALQPPKSGWQHETTAPHPTQELGLGGTESGPQNLPYHSRYMHEVSRLSNSFQPYLETDIEGERADTAYAYPSQTPQNISSQYHTQNLPAQLGSTINHPSIYEQSSSLIQIEDTTQWTTPEQLTAIPKYHHEENSLYPSLPSDATSSSLQLDTPAIDSSIVPPPGNIETKTTTIQSKRKSISPPSQITKKPREKQTCTQKAISEFVVVFETAPGALDNVKRRRKLNEPVRKAAREVRKAGSCHQCRFRKRTCSTSTPCVSCVKHGTALLELRCQRETPFVGKPMHQYFQYSSTRRIVSFNVDFLQDSFDGAVTENITIDGIGGVSKPLKLKAQCRPLGSFSYSVQASIKQSKDTRKQPANEDESKLSVVILEDDEELGIRLEQWALEYASEFVHSAGPAFYSTTMAQILGTAYVKKGLPESKLVSVMLRLASLAFVLRAGVKYTGTNPPSRFRTVQARVDTILYQRLKLAEKEHSQILQRLIFRSAGSLSREQIYPVALCLWQLIRILCVGASHLSNIAQRFQQKPSEAADYQFMGLKLVLSTHLALFRSSVPLLLDFSDKFNQDLLGHDPELIQLAMKMRTVVMNFRTKGCPEMKGSIVYRKEYFNLFQKLYEVKYR